MPLQPLPGEGLGRHPEAMCRMPSLIVRATALQQLVCIYSRLHSIKHFWIHQIKMFKCCYEISCGKNKWRMLVLNSQLRDIILRFQVILRMDFNLHGVFWALYNFSHWVITFFLFIIDLSEEVKTPYTSMVHLYHK